MPEKFGAGRLQEKIAFDQRTAIDDGYGNEIAGPFVEQFQQQAEIVQLRAGERVMASRLEGHAMTLLRIRVCADTRRITTDWQARDVRRGTTYNIRDIHQDLSRALFELMAESNVAT